MKSPPLQVGSKVYHVWPKGTASADTEIKDAVQSIQVAVALFQERIDAELPESDLRMSLDIFDLAEHWLDVPSRSPAQKNSVVRKTIMWFRLLKFSAEDCACGVQEFEDAAQLVMSSISVRAEVQVV